MKFYLHSDAVIVDQNPEFADMSNPQGYIMGEAVYVVAENDKGFRWAHEIRWIDDLENARKLLSRVVAAGKIDMKYWHEIDPSYGSEAYIVTGQERKLLHQERMAG